MYRILTSLRELLTWKRGSASQQNEETSEMPGESSNENSRITEEEEESQAFDLGDGDVHIIDTFDTEQPPYFTSPDLNTGERIQNGFFKLLSPSKKLRQDVENLQMSIMYPPGTMPLNPIAELDEQAPESPDDDNTFTVRKKKPFFKSTLEKTIVNANRFKLFWNETTDTAKSYANGIYWVLYAAPGKSSNCHSYKWDHSKFCNGYHKKPQHSSLYL